MPNQKVLLLLGFSLCLLLKLTHAQEATISESKRSLKTYPFSNPNPVPILTSNPSIYPYFKYEGYSHEGIPKEWKVVKLENELVEVFVLPEVGGKVWGAIEKSTGEEFIYRNEVMKFRNISMRGPWTSGGIEFNFGIIGHHPSTATPVDYVVEEHEDGSVSCTVGNIDLPSRTQWRVQIILPKDKAYFETQAVWYNPTPMQQSYYNWMTAAAPARQDFEFYTPGDQYLKHSGEAKPWPYDDMGRDISLYKENNFGPSKSYHVVGEYNDFFGGYYHDGKYGFGHWSEYEEIPGQKLWLWALSRSGGIWEDLLTDTDGQYIEFQAGRLFVQFSPDPHKNPITQATFEPHTTDTWREIWFPVKEIGGMKDVSEKAVMNVEKKGGQLHIGINAFQESKATLLVSGGNNLHSQEISLKPMEVFTHVVDLQGNDDFDIRVDGLDIQYDSSPEDKLIERPFETASFPEAMNSAEKLYREGMEELKFRRYADAKQKLKEALQNEPLHADAMVALAELYFRQGLYDKGLAQTHKALQLDTYNPHANYLAGILYRAKGDKINAKESLGWAARSMQYRSNAYAQMGEILLSENNFAKAMHYAEKSLDFNRYNVNAWHVKAIAARKSGQKEVATNAISSLRKLDPLSHFVGFESYLLSEAAEDRARFIQSNRSELAYQTFLELAIDYYNKGLSNEAVQILDMAPQHPMIDLWWTYIQQDENSNYLQGLATLSPAFAFPFRRETLHALEWANQHLDHWKVKYYLALNLWGKDRLEEAAALMAEIGDKPDNAAFYLARADLLAKVKDKDPLTDLQRAHDFDEKDFRTWRALTAYYQDRGKVAEAQLAAEMAYEAFPNNYATGTDYARALNRSGKYEESITVLEKLQVLPFEGASEGRRLYEQAHLWAALNLIKAQQYRQAIPLLEKSKQWPESLGVGKPFDPDERVADYLLGYCFEKTKKRKDASAHYAKVAAFSTAQLNGSSYYHLLGLLANQKLSDPAAANRLMELMLSSQHGSSAITQWIAAVHTSNDNKQKTLLKQYPQMSNSNQFKLLQEILALE